MSELVIEARIFAKAAHEGQVRKYTKEPYFEHVEAVAKIVESVGGTPEMIAAAYLHDTVEDTDTRIEEILELFGPIVAEYVYALTDSPLVAGNRATRKQLDRQRIGNASAEVQTIKCADVISNTGSIAEYDGKFSRFYTKEIAEMLPLLRKAHPGLLARAGIELRKAQEKLVQESLNK